MKTDLQRRSSCLTALSLPKSDGRVEGRSSKGRSERRLLLQPPSQLNPCAGGY
jgi:hypothetical protein